MQAGFDAFWGWDFKTAKWTKSAAPMSQQSDNSKDQTTDIREM